MTQTITGLYDTYNEASSAVLALERSGISHSDISIVSNNSDDWHGKDRDTDAAEDAGTGAGIGAAVGGIGGLLTGLGLMAIPGATRVTARARPDGGALVTAKVPDDQAASARSILQQTKSVDLNTRAAAYRETGWSAFDSDAPAYTADQVASERTRYMR